MLQNQANFYQNLADLFRTCTMYSEVTFFFFQIFFFSHFLPSFRDINESGFEHLWVLQTHLFQPAIHQSGWLRVEERGEEKGWLEIS